MEFIPIAAITALTIKSVDLLRYLRAGDVNGVVTQLAAWIGGAAIAILAAQTDWADGITVGDQNLATLNIWSLIFWGMAAGSTASLVKDTTKALDNTNSAAIPTLLPLPGRHQQTTTKSPRGGTTEVG